MGEAVSQEVLNGVRRLDDMGPNNWRDILRPKLGGLHTNTMYQCPLYYLYGDFSRGMIMLGIEFGTASRYGFNGDHGDSWRRYFRLYDAEVASQRTQEGAGKTPSS